MRPVGFRLCVMLSLACIATIALGDDELDKKVEKKLAEVKAGLDGSFRVERDGCFVVAGNLPRARFDRIRRWTIRAAAERMWTAYFEAKPDYPIIVYLFRGDKSYRAWAKKLFNDTEVSHFGYYRPWDQTLVMNIGTGTGTLVHELTHALMKPDFPDVPTWFDEGLASLHEQCRIGPKTVIGLENWRLPGLQKAIREKRLVPLTDLVATPTAEFRGENEGLHYAEARYLCLYLQRQGLLRKFYRAFRDGHQDDPTGAKTLVRITGQPLADLEKTWVPWVLELRFPPR
ncbi:MAG: hypothetical protein ACODAJ_05810 [Planctomycetota bacterium]